MLVYYFAPFILNNLYTCI